MEIVPLICWYKKENIILDIVKRLKEKFTPASRNRIWMPLAESISLASLGFIYFIIVAGSPRKE